MGHMGVAYKIGIVSAKSKCFYFVRTNAKQNKYIQKYIRWVSGLACEREYIQAKLKLLKGGTNERKTINRLGEC